MSHRLRALVLAHLLTAAALGACAKPAAHRAATTASEVPNVGFDQAFAPLNSVALQLPRGEVLGVPTGLIRSGPLVVIADGAQANLKVFDRATGAFVRTIGRAGDGPGEFRSPVGIELDRNGRLLVLDNRRSVISRRDLDGTIRDERVLIGVVTGLASVGDSDLWVTGRIRERVDSARRGRAEPILSQLDGSLNPIRALLPTEWPAHPWEQTFANYFASPVGARLVVATFRTDEFQIVTPASGASCAGVFQAAWYHRPEWPTDSRALAGKSSIQELERWLRQQTLIHRVTGVGNDLVIGMAQIFDSTGGHDYAYIVADTAGHSRLSTGPTDFLLLRAAGDTLLGVRLQADGAAFLETRLLRRDLLAVGAKASPP